MPAAAPVAHHLKSSNPLTAAVTTKIPVPVRVLKKRLQDLVVSAPLLLNPGAQRRLRTELDGCVSLSDYLAFAERWLGGAFQLPAEIGPALDQICAAEPATVCEIGTALGGTTVLLTRYCPSIRTVVGMDLFVKNKAQLRLITREDQSIHLLDGSSYAPDTVRRVKDVLGVQPIDVLFIDGDHRYEGAGRDFLNYRSLLREGSLVLFHDIVQDHAVRFGTSTRSYSGGVPKLWAQLKALYQHDEYVEDPDQDGMGIGILRYSGAVPLPDSLLALVAAP
jgi:predicted O-methyltransferase YrrM